MAVPLAKVIEVHRCSNPACPNVHIDLLDERGETMARIALHYEEVPNLMESFKDIVFEIVSQLD